MNKMIHIIKNIWVETSCQDRRCKYAPRNTSRPVLLIFYKCYFQHFPQSHAYIPNGQYKTGCPMAALSSCNEIYSWKVVLPPCHLASQNQTALSKWHQQCFTSSMNQHWRVRKQNYLGSSCHVEECGSSRPWGVKENSTCFSSRRAFAKQQKCEKLLKWSLSWDQL